ncbi:MAG: hypothetical protein IH596_07190 [Bacteroidales bacterium]|nr:hypothetical protein [Bacteroidales bacterium]
MKEINRCSLFAVRYSQLGMRIKKFLILNSSFLILLLFSCSPQSRLQHLISRHPELRLPDTLIVRDTLITPGIQADTTLHIEQLSDTVILEKERLQVRLLRKTDTLWVEGTCNPDTIYYEKQIPVEKIQLVKEPLNLKPVLWLLGALIILIMILSIVKRL